MCTVYVCRKGGDIGLFITLVPKQLWLNNFGDFQWIFIGWFIKLNFQTFQPLITIYRRGHLVCNHWGFTSIYRPLYYPIISLAVYVWEDCVAYHGSIIK